MQDFPSNSQKARAQPEPRPKLEPVTSAKVSKQKRSIGRKFKETFISGDAKSSLEYATFNVVVPSAKDLIYEFFDSAIRTYFFGEQSRNRRG
ncbi:MAG TPA: hypothetical protein VN843_14910, partial [Anaerolineales bacterium]|nr:hypothetical protein [Anaerolineales bacterium]